MGCESGLSREGQVSAGEAGVGGFTGPRPKCIVKPLEQVGNKFAHSEVLHQSGSHI